MPEGWAWASLSEIANIYTGNSINENEKANKYSNLKEGLFYIATKDIDFEGKINYNNGIRIPLAESKFKIAPAESTLLCIEGGSAGRKIGFINQDVCFVNKLCCFHSDYLSNLYLFYYLQSRTFIDLFNSNKSGLIGGVSLNLLKSIFIPVAPAIEQDLISKTIATYLEKITSLNKDKETLELTIKKAKSKILDLAIHGKLVPQDANDEPASVLLEKLRAEKEEKIAKGELKRDKNDSYIYKGSDNCYYEKFANGKIEEIEIPFEIPTTWQWCKLGSICDYGKCISVNTKKLKSEDWILDLEDIEKDTGKIIAFKTFAERKSESTKHKFSKGQVLYSKLRPYLNKVVIAPKDGYCTSEILPLNFNNLLTSRYAQLLLMSSYFLGLVNMVTYGVKMPRLGTEDAKKMLIPIPPLQEQHRIIDKIDTLFSRLDNIHLELV